MAIIIFISIIQGLLFLTHWFVYWTLVHFFDLSAPVSAVAAFIFFFFSISFLIASITSHRTHALPARAFYKLALYWASAFYFLLAASIVCWVMYLLISPVADVSQPTIGTVVFAITFLSAIYFTIKSWFPTVTEVTVALKNLPPHWEGKSVVMLSDLHFGNIYGPVFAKKLAAKINEINPEAVFIPGDFFDGVPLDHDLVTEPFGSLKLTHGVYFASGNHEGYGDKAAFIGSLKRSGVRVLEDEEVDLDGLRLLGYDYMSVRELENYERLASQITKRDDPLILLKHVPNHLEVAEKSGVSLHLSGHTHAAQVFPFRFITRKLFKGYDYGLKEFGDMQVYTSSGAGSWGPPIRVGTHAEIVKITFTQA
jgi:uncharacterized protein